MDFESASSSVIMMDYETQHFGFHPRVFLDRVYNAYYESLFEALNQMKAYFATEYGNVMATELINKNTDCLFQELVKKIDKAIDRLESFLEFNVFWIPDHVLLPEDKIHETNPCTKSEDQSLDKQIEEIKQAILKERLRKSFLKCKREEQKHVKAELLAFEDKLKQILSVISTSLDTQQGLKIAFEKCWDICNKMKQPPELGDHLDLSQKTIEDSDMK